MTEKLQTDSQISHYRIISKLGAGGMGEVWLAEDTRLDRKVALKLLPAEFTEDSERVRRFSQEAKAASALNHPNIITVYDIGECDTGRYIVMELVSGNTLRSVIANDNSVETLFTLGGQMARALSAAHTAGITHRDIKPDNIMIRNDGYVKMLDFGLARLLPTSSSDPEAMTLAQQTTPGTVMGTLAYMSPEQASGLTASSPSDVFALGIVLYELVTGHHPFKAESMLGYLHAITNQSPQSLTSHKSELPVALDELILRMLEKNPNDRPTAGEVVQSLLEIEKYGSNKTLPVRVATRKSPTSKQDEGFWAAVLPFKYRGSNSELESLAEGLSEEITTGLARFSYLRVIALSSTQRYANETTDVRTVGKELGARYLMEGTLRQAGSKIRLTVQLADTDTGAHLWAENYERTFSSESIFELQDDLVPRIVSTVADSHGVLPRSMSETVQNRDLEELSPYEAVLRSFRYSQNVTRDAMVDAIQCLELAVQKAPAYADAWAVLGAMLVQDYAQGYNVRDDSLTLAEVASRKAVDLAPSNHWSWASLARVHFFQKEQQSFRNEVEKAVALNPMDGDSHASLGEMLAFGGDVDRGLQLVERAKQLNPNHPGWYWYINFYQAYRQEDYRAALNFATKVNLPGHWAQPLFTAAARGQLGETELAAKAVSELLRIRPLVATVRTDLNKWFSSNDVEHLLDGARKAGLVVDEVEKIDAESGRGGDAESVTVSPRLPISASSLSSGSLIKSIAVLPFHNLSGDAEQEFFADGITEEILNALAQIPGLRVAGRSSSFSFKGRNEDLRSIGSQLNVGTILEGTLRRSGDRLRITTQLIDASNGYQIWSERYDKVIDDIFNVQDEIASTIAGRLQVSFSEEYVSDQRPTKNIEAYQLYLKGRALLYQRGLSIPKAIECFKQAVGLDPSYAQAWAGLADGYTTSGYSGYQRPENVMPLALEAAKRALELDADLAESHNALACATMLWEKNFELAEVEFRRALELNPNYSQARAWFGLFFLQWICGREEEVREEMRKLIQIDPLSAYTHVIFCFAAVCSGRFDEGVAHGKRGAELDPNSYLAQWCRGLSLEYDGKFEEAAIALEKALAMSGRHTWALMQLVSNYAAWGKVEDGRAVLRELEARSGREYIQPGMLVAATSSLGEIDRAIEYAQYAVDIKDPMFLMLARTWPDYKNVRDDPRFRAIVGQLNLPDWAQ